jgi:hypothetical protein
MRKKARLTESSMASCADVDVMALLDLPKARQSMTSSKFCAYEVPEVLLLEPYRGADALEYGFVIAALALEFKHRLLRTAPQLILGAAGKDVEEGQLQHRWQRLH